MSGIGRFVNGVARQILESALMISRSLLHGADPSPTWWPTHGSIRVAIGAIPYSADGGSGENESADAWIKVGFHSARVWAQ